MGFQISLCQFHKNSLSERLLEGKDLTLWDELTEHKAVSQKASFQFLTEDISFFTLALNGFPNTTLRMPQEQPYRKASWRERFNSVRWINRTQIGFSESLFPVFIGSYFLFHHTPMGLQISPCKFHRNSLSERLLEGKAIIVWDELGEHKAVSQKASFQFWTEDISFFTIALYGLPNIPLPIPQEQP